ncbi:MAG TPA: hypothetical protein VGA99_12170 [bacterium]
MTKGVIPQILPSTKAWLILVAVIGAAVVLVWVSPQERSLGSGIKFVYVHVSLTWAGMAGFTAAGVMGAVLTFIDHPRLPAWQESTTWVALTWFTVGVAMAMLAAKINWGAIHWKEPLLVASLRFLAAALLVQIAKRWLISGRLRGALDVLLAFFLMWSILGTPQVMHPQSPIRQSSSLAIQLTFLGMFILSSLAAAWTVWQFRRFFTTEPRGNKHKRIKFLQRT